MLMPTSKGFWHDIGPWSTPAPRPHIRRNGGIVAMVGAGFETTVVLVSFSSLY